MSLAPFSPELFRGEGSMLVTLLIALTKAPSGIEGHCASR